MVTNKQIALVFREAKKDLHIGANASLHKSKYICLAIDGRVNLPIEHRKAALAIIKERLEDKYTLAEWLASKGVSYEDMTDARLHAHRHKWLNSLSKEFSK